MGEEWSHKFSVDSKSGKKYRIYKYKGRPCKRVILDSKICDQMAGYALIQKDLKSAIVWMKEIDRIRSSLPKVDGEFHFGQERESYDIVKGLFVASLTFYGKCFSKCDGRPVKLERRQLDERYHELHDIGISYRHNFAAHSGAEKLETARVVLIAPEKIREGTRTPYMMLSEIEQPDLVWNNGDEGVSWIELFDYVRNMVLKKGQLLNDKVVKDVVEANGVESMFK
ncbi:hypothetical protein [Pseudomonas sp. NPDC087817]|uniref:hypothetical protein n=1 Tax=Pseudomonas sp. NPDC087817 TaxID=3364451 RepID=UPI003823F35E